MEFELYGTQKNMNLFTKRKSDPDNYFYYRNLLVENNLALVSRVLSAYKPYTEDQFQVGCLGLIASVDTFDETRCVPFPSWAGFCINRELHKSHKEKVNTFEHIMGANMIYLDSQAHSQDGDGMSQEEIIPDILAEDAFNEILERHDLEKVFSNIIYPAIEIIAKRTTKGPNTKLNFEQWRDLELRYIIELSQLESQKIRFNLVRMADILGVSLQNVRIRHQRVMQQIREEGIRKGYVK